MGLQPARQRVIVGDERGAPLFRLVQRQRALRRAQGGGGHGLAQRGLVGAMHQLADVLHLAAAALVGLGAPEHLDRVTQGFGHFDGRQRGVGQLGQGHAERLQLVRTLLELGLARAFVGDFRIGLPVVNVDAAVRCGLSCHGCAEVLVGWPLS